MGYSYCLLFKIVLCYFMLINICQAGTISSNFCFPLCGSLSCTGFLYTQCSTCIAAFSLTGAAPNSCTKTAYNQLSNVGPKWEPCGISDDIPAFPTYDLTNNTAVYTIGTFPYFPKDCGGLTYYGGDLQGPGSITIKHPGVSSTTYFYMVRLTLGFVSFDNWGNAHNIDVKFLSNSSQSTRGYDHHNTIASNLCKLSGNQQYTIISQDFLYSTYGTTFDFKITTTNPSTTMTWGISNVIVMVRVCHAYCATCTGDDYAGSCTSCNTATSGLKLSGATCDFACLSGYGSNTTNPNICIKCIPNCFYCLDGSANCKDCLPSFYLFSYAVDNFACVASCPSHYFPSTIGNDSCLICDSSCLDCSITATNCTSCPSHYYLNSVGFGACIICDSNCLGCSILPTNCTLCGQTMCLFQSKCYPECPMYDCINYLFNSLTNRWECSLCSPLFNVDSNLKCEQCKQPGKIYITRTCVSNTGCLSSQIIGGAVQCVGCNSNFYFQYFPLTKQCKCQDGFKLNSAIMQCEQICGDGVRNVLQCDDGNKLNNDGCSSQCLQQQNYDCITNSMGLSQCIWNQDINFQFDYIYKFMNQNTASIHLTMDPWSDLMKNVKWKDTVTMNLGGLIVVPQIYYSNGELVLTFHYNQTIQNSQLNLNIMWNPLIINSKSQNLNLKMKGINGALLYSNEDNSGNYQAISYASSGIGFLCLIVFIFSSYFHKMIGLETIQFIQLIYFIRLMTDVPINSSVYAFNSLKYSYGYNDINISSSSEKQIYKSVPQPFVRMNLKLYFLDNCNLMLISIILICIIYSVYFIKMTTSRSDFVKTKQKIHKDQYIITRRKVDWIYDNLIFSYTLSLLYVAIFSMLIYFVSILSNSSSFHSVSFIGISMGLSLVILYFVYLIFVYETTIGIRKYMEIINFKSNVVSDQANLNHDANGVKHGFHPLYVSVYLIYQLTMISSMCLIFIEFQFLIETVLSLSILYFIIILVWKPYSLKIHNSSIIFNQSVLILFILIQLLAQLKLITSLGYNVFIYITILFIYLGLILQIVRVYLHKKLIDKQEDRMSKRQRNPIQNNQQQKVKNQHNQYLVENQITKMIQQEKVKFKTAIFQNPYNILNTAQLRQKLNVVPKQQKIKRNRKQDSHLQSHEYINKTMFAQQYYDVLNKIKNKLRLQLNDSQQ